MLQWLRREQNRRDRERAEALEHIEYSLRNIDRVLHQILHALRPPKLILTYTTQGGTIMGAPVTMNIGQTANPSVVETAAGASVAVIGPLVYASDNAAVVSVDPSAGVATGVSAGTANVSVIDQANNLTDTVAFTINAPPPPPPPPADTLSLNFTVNA